jgi:hypothetical protein
MKFVTFLPFHNTTSFFHSFINKYLLYANYASILMIESNVQQMEMTTQTLMNGYSVHPVVKIHDETVTQYIA